MKRALFINADKDKPHCAVFQAGEIYFKAMQYCAELDIDYLAVGSKGGTLPDPRQYDMVIFNYQHVTMQIMPPDYFKLPKLSLGFLYEARSIPADSPSHTGVPVGEIFDILISPDPTLQSTHSVWAVPRVIPRSGPRQLVKRGGDVWVSTFGFPSPWKNLGEVVRMMRDEFKEATFRINFAPASHQEGTPLQEMAMQMVNDLHTLIRPGIQISYTTHFMEDAELIMWLGQSDVNVFLSHEERGIQTGGALLASADMAIASRASLMVSDNVEARHLKSCQWKTLRKAIDGGEPKARELYDRWSPETFADRMDELVRDN